MNFEQSTIVLPEVTYVLTSPTTIQMFPNGEPSNVQEWTFKNSAQTALNWLAVATH